MARIVAFIRWFFVRPARSAAVCVDCGGEPGTNMSWDNAPICPRCAARRAVDFRVRP